MAVLRGGPRAPTENASEQRAILREIDRLKHDLGDLGKQRQNAANACLAAGNAVQKKREIWASKKAELEDLNGEFGRIEPLTNAADLETAKVQEKGLWYDRELAVLRTKLFAAALCSMDSKAIATLNAG